jgi:hypothetical protein
MGITGDTWEAETLNVDCGILPASLTRTVELATLHAHLITVKKDRLGAQIHRHLAEGPPIPNTWEERMHMAHSELRAEALWNVPPTPPDGPQGPHTPQTRVRSRRTELNKKASEVWRQHLLDKIDPTSDAPTDALHQYVITAHTDLLRKNLNTPAPYLKENHNAPTLPLLRLRCQNLNKLRACHPEHQLTPYAGRACLRCNPVLKDPHLLFIPMHLEVDNNRNAATSCPATAGPRDRALTRLAEVYY